MSFLSRCSNCGRRALLPVMDGKIHINCHLALDDAGEPILGCAYKMADPLTKTLVTKFFISWSLRTAESSDRLKVASHRRGRR
jgi:hypothetical protein